MTAPTRTLLALFTLVVFAGCQPVPVNPRPRIAEPPPGVMPDRAAITVQPPVDTDQNKHADTVGVFVYLFPKPNEYAMPIWTHGSYRFVLTSSVDGTEMAVWSYDPDQTADARFRTEIGPCYMFQLRLADASVSDEFERHACELRAVFTPTDGGTPVDGRISFQLGG